MSGQNIRIEDWLGPLRISPDKLCSLACQLSTTYSHLALHSEEQFLSTPVTKFPSGKEQGEYLAIDLGGTNLRIAFVTLLGTKSEGQTHSGEQNDADVQDASHDVYSENVRKSYGRSWPIDDHLKAENADDLFNWVGDCLAGVVRARFRDANTEELVDEIPLGITFSFPMIQSSLAKATLMPMGKGFAINSSHELGAMVCAGYARHMKSSTMNGVRPKALPRIKVAAIANDSVSTLMSLMYSSKRMLQSKTVIGLILGTGCNAATIMKLEALNPSKWPSTHNGLAQSEVVVNTEWTIKGAAPPLHELELVSCWDSDLHRSTHQPGFQPFEYMTAGSYLGEVVRLVLHDWYTNVLRVSESHLPSALIQRNSVTTTFLAQSVAPAENPLALAAELNRTGALGTNEHWIWTAELARALMEAEKAVLRRSAAMIAAAIVGLLLSTGELVMEQHQSSRAKVAPQFVRELVVTYCGGLICLYKGYKEHLQEFLEDLLRQLEIRQRETRIVLREASEGGIVGAAVLASTDLEHHCPEDVSRLRNGAP
ncbi:hypothetical protein MMC30_007543 [Trapelia coarctata]|nr:hypothetical protein [Trapelia coarctata]